MPHTIKSVKVSLRHHHCLKERGAELGLTLQQYLAFILELSFSEEPLLKDAREAYFSLIKDRQESVLEMARRIQPQDGA